jgi:hypothetical protein
MPNPVVWRLLLKLLAAFCAAEKTEEKKPEPAAGFARGVGSSVVGVRELERTLESLLGAKIDDADALLVCPAPARDESTPSVPITDPGLEDTLLLKGDSSASR